MKIVRLFLRYLWLWVLLFIIAGVVFFTLSGNDPILPAIYR